MSEWASHCEVCRAFVDEDDLFCGNCGTEATCSESEADETTEVVHSFVCHACGAAMSYSAERQTLVCPFCGSEEIEEQGERFVRKAKWLVPFQVGREQATKVWRQWVGNDFWRPIGFARSANVERMMPVYAPYWVFRAKTTTYWTADSDQLPPSARGDWCPVYGERHGEYRALLVGASGALTTHETSVLVPYDLKAAVDADNATATDAAVEQFGLTRKEARPIARQSIEQFERSECSRSVHGRLCNLKLNMVFDGLSSDPVFLPVWIMSYRFRGKLFRFLINGQTGEAMGAAPTSRMKLYFILAGIGFCLLAGLAWVGRNML